jgi:adenylyltransferase/sulfurtransferase
MLTELHRINPLPRYITHPAHLTPESALPIVGAYDVVLDCTDNPATRYLVSDACVLLSKPLVSASALRTDGQLTVLNYPPAPAGMIKTIPKVTTDDTAPFNVEVAAGGPCYRCIWPVPPPPSAVQTCGEGGILGPVVGTMGVLQALEAMKIIIRDPSAEVLAPQMHLFSTYPTLGLRSVRLRPRRPQCASCSVSATITKESLSSGSVDYVAFCGGLLGEANVLSLKERVLARDVLSTGCELVASLTTSPFNDMKTNLAAPLIVDLREKTLYDLYHLRDSVNISYSELSAWRSIADIPDVVKNEKSSKILLLCARGNDSQLGVKKLRSLLKKQDDQITDVVSGWLGLRGLVDFPQL